jgi:hypothetical protein
LPPLLFSLDENSIPWIAVSGVIGALSAAGIRFLFDQVLSPGLQSARKAKAAVRRYSYPLLRAAETLDRRIENLIRFADQKWFDDPDDDYYRLSTLYLFGCYFGWCNILENEAFLEYVRSDRKARVFSTRFYTVFKGITGFFYFQDLITEEELSTTEVENATVPRLALTAIGELMTKSPEGNGGMSKVCSFVEFTRSYSESEDFKKWFAYVHDLLFGLEPGRLRPRWNRLLVFATNLRSFVSFLDPALRQTRPRKIFYLPRLHPKVESRLRKELLELGYSDLIAE